MCVYDVYSGRMYPRVFVEVRRQLGRVSSLVLPFCGSQGLNLSSQVCVKRVFTH